MSNDYLVTIHGVNSDGEIRWQDTIGAVLKPHFNCVHIRYNDYNKKIGLVKAVFEPILLIATILAIVSALICFSREQYNGGISLSVLSIILLASSARVSHLSRKKRVDWLKGELDAKLPAFTAPYVIAHSFGTYLIGAVIKKFPGPLLARVVLVSSILRRDYPWESLISAGENRVIEVRNEYVTCSPL